MEASWVVVMSTALSGLGSTLSGLYHLYGLTQTAPASQGLRFQTLRMGVAHCLRPQSATPGASFLPAVAGGMASGAVAYTVAKIGSVGTALSVSALGSMGGCVYASVGALYFAYTILKLNTVKPPRHAPMEDSPEASAYPSPNWLSTRVLNWGVIGRVGVGKSSVINALRGLSAGSPGAAPVGIGHTTRVPRPYNFTGEFASMTHNMARLWDLPGAGTKAWPAATYVKDAGLRYLDGVIFVTSDVFLETEVDLIERLLEFKVPYYILRNKVDQDMLNNAQDNNATPDETLAEIRYDLKSNGCDPLRTFLVSARYPERSDLEFSLLLRAMANDVRNQRSELPEFLQDGFSLEAAATHMDVARPFRSSSCGASSSNDRAQLLSLEGPASQRLDRD